MECDLKLDASLDQPAGATLLMAVAIGNKLNRSSRFRRRSRSRFAEVLGIWKAVAARMRSSGTLGQNYVSGGVPYHYVLGLYILYSGVLDTVLSPDLVSQCSSIPSSLPRARALLFNTTSNRHSQYNLS